MNRSLVIFFVLAVLALIVFGVCLLVFLFFYPIRRVAPETPTINRTYAHSLQKSPLVGRPEGIMERATVMDGAGKPPAVPVEGIHFPQYQKNISISSSATPLEEKCPFGVREEMGYLQSHSCFV